MTDEPGLECAASGRGAGVVERAGFENRCPRKGTQGSNPCLSALRRDVGVVERARLESV